MHDVASGLRQHIWLAHNYKYSEEKVDSFIVKGISPEQAADNLATAVEKLIRIATDVPANAASEFLTAVVATKLKTYRKATR